MIIYKVINRINGKIYIGLTKNSLEQRRIQHFSECLSSSKTKFHNALRKYGKEGFIWEEVDFAETIDELRNKEIFWIKFYNSIDFGYNINKGGSGGDNYTDNPNLSEIKLKIGIKVKQSNRWTPERRKQQSINFSGKNNPMRKNPERSFFSTNNPMNIIENRFIGDKNAMSREDVKKRHLEACRKPERLKKISEKLKGKKLKPLSQETKNKISQKNKGKIRSLEVRERISKSTKGRIVSEETRKKMSLAATGKIFSEETRRKISESRKSRNNEIKK